MVGAHDETFNSGSCLLSESVQLREHDPEIKRVDKGIDIPSILLIKALIHVWC